MRKCLVAKSVTEKPIPDLGSRLGFVASLIPTTGDLWDIGCDHGLILEWALQQGREGLVVGVDRSIEVIQRLRKNPRLTDHSQVRLYCDLGQRLDWNKVLGTVVIAGIGWPNIKKILSTALSAERIKRNWILSPNADHETVLSEIFQFEELAIWKAYTIVDRQKKYLILNGTPL